MREKKGRKFGFWLGRKSIAGYQRPHAASAGHVTRFSKRTSCRWLLAESMRQANLAAGPVIPTAVANDAPPLPQSPSGGELVLSKRIHQVQEALEPRTAAYSGGIPLSSGSRIS